jgi:membrane protease YdiL (CAAX protease family)
MLSEAKLSAHKPSVIIQILIFAVVFFAVQTAAGIAAGIPAVFWMLGDPDVMGSLMSGDVGSAMTVLGEGPAWLSLAMLYATVFEIVLTMVYCRGIEGRSLRSMGFVKRKWAAEYFSGFAIGAAMLSSAGLLAALFGGMSFSAAVRPQVLYIILFLGGYAVQGAGEEVMLRGYFMVSLTNRTSVAAAVGISSVVFSLLHVINPGFTVLAFVNITLFGVLMALFVLRRDSILGACALHSAWNFFQGCVFGVRVSGTAPQPSVLQSCSPASGVIFNGGDFGLEGGLASTIVLLAALAAVYFLPARREDGVYPVRTA